MKKDGGKTRSVEDIEVIISRILQVGVITSACVVAIGLALYLITGSSGYPGSTFPSSPAAILQGLIGFKPYAVMLLGLTLLILTPVLRVGISVLVFIREKDYLYVKITALVFTILIVSFILGKVE
jgi:uncharacterized membrane protein